MLTIQSVMSLVCTIRQDCVLFKTQTGIAGGVVQTCMQLEPSQVRATSSLLSSYLEALPELETGSRRLAVHIRPYTPAEVRQGAHGSRCDGQNSQRTRGVTSTSMVSNAYFIFLPRRCLTMPAHEMESKCH